MSEPTGDDRTNPAPRRNPLSLLILGLVVAAGMASAEAGPIRPRVRAKTLLQATAADQWGPYWRAALNYRWMDVRGPKAVSLLKLSADGTLPESPFVEYLVWRQSLNVKRFNSFHPGIVQLLRRIKPSRIPPTITPIDPPDFTPITPQEVTPPQVPEPSTGLIAALMIGAAAAARKWSGRR